MRINYFGTLYAIRAVVPAMQARGDGHVVLVSSVAELVGIFGYSAQAPSDTPQLAEERHFRPIETGRIAAKAGLWQADDTARILVRGIARGRLAITPGWPMTLLYRCGGLAAPVISRYFDRLARWPR